MLPIFLSLLGCLARSSSEEPMTLTVKSNCCNKKTIKFIIVDPEDISKIEGLIKSFSDKASTSSLPVYASV